MSEEEGSMVPSMIMTLVESQTDISPSPLLDDSESPTGGLPGDLASEVHSLRHKVSEQEKELQRLNSIALCASPVG